MTNCPHCRQPVDVSATMCPNCHAALSGQAPSSPPSTLPPRRNTAAPQDAGPRLQVDSINLAMWIALILVPTVLIACGVLYYKKQDAAFKKELHWNLSTPKSAAKEVFGAVKDEAWAKFYLLCQFQNEKVGNAAEAERWAQGYRTAMQSNQAGYKKFRTLMDGLTDLQFGSPQVKGDLADVAISASVHAYGKVIPLNGIAHLVNGTDNKWRLNMSGVNLNTPERDGIEFSRVFGSLFDAGQSEARFGRPERSRETSQGGTTFGGWTPMRTFGGSGASAGTQFDRTGQPSGLPRTEGGTSEVRGMPTGAEPPSNPVPGATETGTEPVNPSTPAANGNETQNGTQGAQPAGTQNGGAGATNPPSGNAGDQAGQ